MTYKVILPIAALQFLIQRLHAVAKNNTEDQLYRLLADDLQKKLNLHFTKAFNDKSPTVTLKLPAHYASIAEYAALGFDLDKQTAYDSAYMYTFFSDLPQQIENYFLTITNQNISDGR
jgi:hypothetical protein